MKILIVDDSLAARSFTARILKKQGHECLMAAHGGEALQQLTKEFGIDLALVDWNMPVMDGLDMVKSVRKDASCPQIPIIMVSSEAELDRVAVALEAGADEYLMKPFTDAELALKIQMTLSARGGQQ